MYNTLKEVQKAYSYDKLYEIAKKIAGENPEKIVEIFKNEDIDISLDAANECIEYLKNINTLKDEELTNVAGGGCYSDETYGSLGIEPGEGQLSSYHPRIVASFMHCDLDPQNKPSCTECEYCYYYSEFGRENYYCTIRSEEKDPLR